MSHRIALVTDSNAQLPATLRDAYRVGVVPITIVVDFEARPEAEWESDEFAALLAGGATASTSQPSPSEFVEVWRPLIEAGAEEIVSVHIAEAYSGTLNSARLATELVDVPVHLVDSGQTSFGIGACVWQAAEARSAGGEASAMVAAAERTAGVLRNAFFMDGLDLARSTGRLGAVADTPPDPVTIWSLVGSDLDALGGAADLEGAAEVIADAIVADGGPVRVGVGGADSALDPATDALEKLLRARDEVDAVVRYRVGPSVMVATGPGAFGAYWFPVGD